LKNDSEQIDNGGDGLPDFIKGWFALKI
jgi:hypothetical protein